MGSLRSVAARIGQISVSLFETESVSVRALRALAVVLSSMLWLSKKRNKRRRIQAAGKYVTVGTAVDNSVVAAGT